MMMQLQAPIPLETPKGDGFAHLVIDYGQEHYLHFVCFLNDSGDCWIFDNRQVRMQPNFTMGVRNGSNAAPPHAGLTPRNAAVDVGHANGTHRSANPAHVPKKP